MVMKLQLLGEIAILSITNGITLVVIKLIILLFPSRMTDFSSVQMG